MITLARQPGSVAADPPLSAPFRCQEPVRANYETQAKAGFDQVDLAHEPAEDHIVGHLGAAHAVESAPLGFNTPEAWFCPKRE
ncbi:hypothetical protein [Methylobacterium nigriterrae]|uniref:hypothetical protein n=1 Tax=Methylobacterium nigriterrae TaxID=3127512 RepID=UPI0030137B59